MSTTSTVSTCAVLENIQNHFDFLFRRGFHITSVLFAGDKDEKWQVMLTAGDFLIMIYGDGQRVGMALSSLAFCDSLGFVELDDLIDLIDRDGNRSRISEPACSEAAHTLAGIARSFEEYMEDIWILMEKICLLISNGKSGLFFLDSPDFFCRWSHN